MFSHCPARERTPTRSTQLFAAIFSPTRPAVLFLPGGIPKPLPGTGPRGKNRSLENIANVEKHDGHSVVCALLRDVKEFRD